MAPLPEKVKTMLQKPVFVHFATEMTDGSGPQVSPVWVDVDGDTILVNSSVGRLKDKNVRADTRVALSATDPANPYHSIMIRGRVKEITTDGAEEHIDKLAKKYRGLDVYPNHSAAEPRVIYKIEAEKISVMG
jgi:PPOX class probable F420-dependent enzyme